MDYLFFSMLKEAGDSSYVHVTVSYDIACQWSKNLWKRMETYPRSLHIDHHRTDFTFLVPKFHLPAHIEACQTAFSFNLTVGGGRTDGESPERGWANINHTASSTKEMGPGSRRDFLDDHFGDWNHKKVISLGRSFSAVNRRFALTQV
jgi:hypothetical protein